jgi:prepilin-type N-terminal cleavage/methylation domain-containing protein
VNLVWRLPQQPQRGAQRPQAQRRGNPSGFTLVELIVVMIILAVMITLAIPAFRSWVDEDDMTVATRRVEALFRLARDSAVRSGTPVAVLIDSVSSRVWLVSMAMDSASAVAVPNPDKTGQNPAASGEELGLPEQVQLQLTRARASFRFAPSGAVFADTLVLMAQNTARIITLNPWTGDLVY